MPNNNNFFSTAPNSNGMVSHHPSRALTSVTLLNEEQVAFYVSLCESYLNEDFTPPIYSVELTRIVFKHNPANTTEYAVRVTSTQDSDIFDQTEYRRAYLQGIVAFAGWLVAKEICLGSGRGGILS